MFLAGSETLASNWCKDILAGIMAATPHTWSSYTLASFPPALSEFFQQQVPPARDDKQLLKRNVEMELRKWKSKRCEYIMQNRIFISSSSS